MEKSLKNCGRDYIYLTGSQKTIERTIYTDNDGNSYCKFYGDLVAVERSKTCGYHTKERY